jgi:Xaa-Pro aminopeptidase
VTKRDHLEASLRKEMESAGVDALIAVSPENVQHLTGTYIISQRMIPDRLAFAVYPRMGPPFFVVSTVVEYTARTQSWIDDVVAFTEHAVLPINGLIQALRDHGLERGRAWIEIGYLPARDADILRSALPRLKALDAEQVLNRSRMIKAPAEIQRMSEIARVWEEGVRDASPGDRAGRDGTRDRPAHDSQPAGRGGGLGAFRQLRLRSAANADRAFRAGRDRGAPRRHHAA